MSDTILSGDVTVYYEAENRQKRIEWSGSASGTRTVNELYSALQGHFDELTQMDDGTPMSAQTPTEYTIGIIDAGDADPWFVDPVTVEHLTGGAIQTASWARVDTTNTGIIRLDVTVNTIVAADVGFDITHGDGDVGTLLYVEDLGGGVGVLWVRPDSSAVANSFNSSGTLTCNSNTATFTYDVTPPGVTWLSGESLWANIFSIGTIEEDTHLYVYQEGAKLVSRADSSTYDWWPDNDSTQSLDVLILVKEAGAEKDEGFIQVFARQYAKTFDHFEVDLSNGGRNPIPLSTGNDLNNNTGLRQITLSSATGTWDVGNYIYYDDAGAFTWATTTKKAVITSGGTGATPTLEYYLIGDFTDFSNLDEVTEYDPIADANGDANGDVNGAPSDTASPAPPSLAGVSITYGGLADGGSFDVNEDGTPENYSIVIDVSDEDLQDVYEWSKWLTRRGGTTTGNTDGIEGERYIGEDYKLLYSGSPSGAINDGNVVVQAGTLATGTIVNHNTTDKIITLRNSRGTFNTSGLVTDQTTSNTVTPNTAATRITPNKASPFGTFAGGTWFTAPGVVLTNVLDAQANNYQLTSDNGVVVTAPTKVTITVGNTRSGDKVAVFRLTGAGGTIEKDTYTATVHSIGDATLIINEAIAIDEPGRSVGGVLRLVDVSAFQEYRIRFSSWATSTFTLANETGTMDDTGGTTTTTNLHDDGKSFLTTVRVGDLVLNTSQSNAVSYVTAVVDDDNLTIFPAIAGQASGDTYEINAVPVITTTSDTVYIPFIDTYETTGTSGSPGSETAQITFDTNIPVRVRARNAGNILPYEADATITSSGLSNNIIRTADTIFT